MTSFTHYLCKYGVNVNCNKFEIQHRGHSCPRPIDNLSNEHNQLHHIHRRDLGQFLARVKLPTLHVPKTNSTNKAHLKFGV